MSVEAISSSQSTNNVQQTQAANQASHAAPAQETPNASQVQAFNNNLSADSASESQNTRGFGNQAPVEVTETPSLTGNPGDREFQLTGEDGASITLTADQISEAYERFKNSEHYPNASSRDSHPSFWGGNQFLSSTEQNAFKNFLISNTPVPY